MVTTLGPAARGAGRLHATAPARLAAPSVVPATLSWRDDAYFQRLFQSLPWTHFIELIRIDDPLKRAFYEVETLKNRWSVRELKRQLDSLLYERVGLSRDKEGVLTLAKEGECITTPAEMVRDGQTVVQNHEVVVRAGQQTRVDIDFPAVALSRNQE